MIASVSNRTETLVELAQTVLKERLEAHTGLYFSELETVMMIGSCVNPHTARKNSDTDLVLLINDSCVAASKDFKVGLQTKLTAHHHEPTVVDVLAYTVSGFSAEMCWGSLTRVYAILNAYKILHSRTGKMEAILALANERKDAAVAAVKAELMKLGLTHEIQNLTNYFSAVVTVLFSKASHDNLVLGHLRLSEFMKEFLVQVQRIIFARDVQENRHNPEIDKCIWNLLVFQNSDGTRLLDQHKYHTDSRIKTLVSNLNTVLSGKYDIHTTITKVTAVADDFFYDMTGSRLLVQSTDSFEFFKKYQIKLA